MRNNQFVVPQFIEVETKIIGPISGRQFVIMLVTFGLCYVFFTLFQSPYIFLPLIAITFGLGGALAFIKVNGQSMHYVLLNLFQTFRKPGMRVWKREVSREKQEKIDEVQRKKPTPKTPATASRLAEMSLLVDTGGVYRGENTETSDMKNK